MTYIWNSGSNTGAFGLVFAILVAASGAFACNVGGLVGAWAPGGDADTSAVVVVEHDMAWALEDGYWRPFRLGKLGADDNRDGATLVPFGKSATPVFSIEKSGMEPDCVVFGAGAKRKTLVRAETPDWEKVCGTNDFVGTWAKEKSPCYALIVRAGGTGAVVPIREDSADEDGLEYSIEFDWKRDCAGVRIFPREDAAHRLRTWKPCVMALRPGAKSADAVCPMLAGELVRDAAKVPDPIEKRRKMAANASYHGMWVQGDREKGHCFYISQKGRGILVSAKLGFDVILPFNWKALDGGKVHCVLFPEFVAGTKCWFNEFDFVYHPTRNEIELIIPGDAQSGESDAAHTQLEFYCWSEKVDIVIEELRKGKGSNGG